MTVPPQSAGRSPHPVCSICGRPMAEDQEWCLECGAGRTVIARPPDWRIPVLVIGVIVLLIAGGFVIALTQLDHNAGKVYVKSGVTTGNGSGTHTQAIASWPPGLDGYTVVLATASSQSAADTAAKRLESKVKGVGVLDSAHYPDMSGPATWDIFAGRYPTYALAQAAAKTADHEGETSAQPALVQRPGGG